MKLSIHPAIAHTVNLEFETQAGAVNYHFKSEIQIVKLNPSCRR